MLPQLYREQLNSATLNSEKVFFIFLVRKADEHRIFQEYENDQNNIRSQLNDYENLSY